MTLQLEIISPEKIVFRGEAELAVIPGEEGDFGVLSNHSPIVAQLREGEVEIYADANGTKLIGSYSIAGGFAQTDGVTCTILSDDVTIVDEFHPAPAHEGGNSTTRSEAEKEFMKTKK